MTIQEKDLACGYGDPLKLWVVSGLNRVSAGAGTEGDGWTNYPFGRYMVFLNDDTSPTLDTEGDCEYEADSEDYGLEKVTFLVYSNWVDEGENTLILKVIFRIKVSTPLRWLENPIVEKRYVGVAGQRMRYFPYYKEMDYQAGTIVDVPVVPSMDFFADKNGVVTLEYARLMRDLLKRNPKKYLPNLTDLLSDDVQWFKDEAATLTWYLTFAPMDSTGVYTESIQGIENVTGIRGGVGKNADWLSGVIISEDDTNPVFTLIPAKQRSVRNGQVFWVSVFFKKFIEALSLEVRIYSKEDTLKGSTLLFEDEVAGLGDPVEKGLWTFGFNLNGIYSTVDVAQEAGDYLLITWTDNAESSPVVIPDVRVNVDASFQRKCTQLVWRNPQYGWEQMNFFGDWENEATLDRQLGTRLGFPFSPLEYYNTVRQLATDVVEEISIRETRQLASPYLTPAERERFVYSFLASKEVYEVDYANSVLSPIRILNSKNLVSQSEPGKTSIQIQYQYLNETNL